MGVEAKDGARVRAPILSDEFLKGLAERHLKGLWELAEVFEPSTPARPYLWRWEVVREQLFRSADVVSVADAERLALLLMNPGMTGKGFTTHTLGASVQMVRPGDLAPPHRHTFSAIRFVIEGKGAYTYVDGERIIMAPGDLILTPSWAWHEHANEVEEPVIWLDGLDTLTRQLGAYFKELGKVDRMPVERPTRYSERKYHNQLRPMGSRPTSPYSPQLAYRWADTYETLTQLAAGNEASPYEDIALEYVSPMTGGHALPIMGCAVQMLRPGTHTKAHRHTSSSVYHAFRGHGETIVNGERFAWSPGDTIAVPNWAWHEHVNGSQEEEAILFSINDIPAMEALYLYREQAYPENDGHQA